MKRTFLVVSLFVFGLMMPGCKRGHGSLSIPGTVQGTLQAGDTQLSDGSVADDHTVWLTAGQPVTVVVRGGPSTSSPGSNLDVYTILMRNGQEITHDDDSAGNFNSRIIYTPTQTGMYTIRVTTYGSGLKTGAYTVQTMDGAHPAQAKLLTVTLTPPRSFFLTGPLTGIFLHRRGHRAVYQSTLVAPPLAG